MFASLQDDVTGYENAASFCCGGSLPISSSSSIAEGFTSATGPITSPPVVIRFDHPDDSTYKIQFPGAEMDTLLEACYPTNFDAKGEGMKAMGLEKGSFSMDWSPYEYGITDAIAQTLLQETSVSLGKKGDERSEHWGVRAELVGLNVSFSLFIFERG